SSDESIASVNDQGEVVGVATGVAAVTVSCGRLSQQVVVDVHRKVRDVYLAEQSVSLLPGQTYQLEPIIEPSDATDPTVTYRSADTTTATVSDSGLVSAVWDSYQSYSATITITSADGPEAMFTVHVENPYEADVEDGTVDMPGTSYQVTPMAFSTAVPDCTGLTVEYGILSASSDSYLSELRQADLDVYVAGSSGGWEKVGTFSLGGADRATAELSFSARSVARVAVAPASASSTGTNWRATIDITAVLFAGQAPQGDT
ncbi:MAG: Ig-like domain-containing protein, partial [Bifidobacteriaceae bacterium]|nr:Ig-like domain-containing protein [Bifidobacteriaceae bacterium]